MNMFKLVPNFEMTMYLAQATGACIVTDSPFRWSEVQGAIRRRYKAATPGLATLVTDIERSKFAFPQSATDVVAAALSKTGAATLICFETSSSTFPISKSAGRNPIARRSWSVGSPKRMRQRRPDSESRACP